MDPQETARLSTEQMWRQDAASRMLGMEVLEVWPGCATVSMTVREDMINGWDVCHGGLVAALADSAFAVACNSHGTVTVAAGFDVTFVAPAKLGDHLVASAVERSRRGRSGLYVVTVRRSGDGEVVAELRGRSHATRRTNPALG